MIEFVSEKTWEKIEPIPGWKSPTSIQMSLISQFFKMSQVLRVKIFINLFINKIDLNFKYIIKSNYSYREYIINLWKILDYLHGEVI